MKTKQDVIEDIEMTIGALRERNDKMSNKTLTIDHVLEILEGIKSNVEQIGKMHSEENTMLEYIQNNRN